MRDCSLVEEMRAPLAQIVDRIEFDPATGEGRMHYALASAALASTATRRLAI